MGFSKTGGEMHRKNAKRNTHKGGHSKGGEQFPAIQMNSAKSQAD